MDKTGFLMRLATKARLISKWGRKNPKYTYNSSRELITVLECVSTGRYFLPFLIVTKGTHYYARNYIRG